MWPASVVREYSVPQPPAHLTAAWRSHIGSSSAGRFFAGSVSDDGFDLTLYQRHGFPIHCRGRVGPTPDGATIHVEFSSGVSFLWVAVAAAIFAGSAFVGLCVWDSTLIGPWGVDLRDRDGGRGLIRHRLLLVLISQRPGHVRSPSSERQAGCRTALMTSQLQTMFLLAADSL